MKSDIGSRQLGTETAGMWQCCGWSGDWCHCSVAGAQVAQAVAEMGFWELVSVEGDIGGLDKDNQGWWWLQVPNTQQFHTHPLWPQNRAQNALSMPSFSKTFVTGCPTCLRNRLRFSWTIFSLAVHLKKLWALLFFFFFSLVISSASEFGFPNSPLHTWAMSLYFHHQFFHLWCASFLHLSSIRQFLSRRFWLSAIVAWPSARNSLLLHSENLVSWRSIICPGLLCSSEKFPIESS